MKTKNFPTIIDAKNFIDSLKIHDIESLVVRLQKKIIVHYPFDAQIHFFDDGNFCQEIFLNFCEHILDTPLCYHAGWLGGRACIATTPLPKAQPYRLRFFRSTQGFYQITIDADQFLYSN